MKNSEDKNTPSVEDVYDEIAQGYANNLAVNPWQRIQIDEIAQGYANNYWDGNPPQANLEFPGTTDLIPDVSEKRILDAGCGSGVYTEWLLEKGANVVAVDISEEMLNQAKESVGNRAVFHQANLEKPLEFIDDNEIDGIVSGSVFDHLESWCQPFAEFTRILKPGGFFVFSIRDPVRNALNYNDWNYFDVERRIENWGIQTPFYLRSVSEVINPLRESGFQIDRITEPQPTDEYKENTSTPEDYERYLREPLFLCLRVYNQ